uniref:Ig-like domain-containing protein n=1 Tax=Cyprinus carpio carpio TaxID=630221 RepID=A0A8C1B742_CYPCA
LVLQRKLIFFFFLPFSLCRLVVCSEWHIFPTLYTEINGETIAGFPEFSAVATLDGQQIDYYDSEIKKLIPKQDWMKKFASGDRERVQQINKLNIPVLMQRFNQSRGVHTYQRMYGCDWDNETGKLHGFDQHGYDGEDFITLDMKELRYITPVAWNRKKILSIFIILFSQSFVAPEVSLLHKDPFSPVVCHATGFYPSAVTITWLRNGEDHDEDVELGELLPNEDGTFQKTSTLRVPPDEWKKDQYVCVVKHETETIQKILRENEIKSNDTYLKKIFLSVAGVSLFLYIYLSIQNIQVSTLTVFL